MRPVEERATWRHSCDTPGKGAVAITVVKWRSTEKVLVHTEIYVATGTRLNANDISTVLGYLADAKLAMLRAEEEDQDESDR